MVNALKRIKKSFTGIQGFDEVTYGGLPSGRSTLICGNAGAGKTIFGMQFIVNGLLNYNENGVVVSFEENEQDLSENVASFGWDLPFYIEQKKLVVDYIYIEKSEIEETGTFSMEGLFIRIAAAIQQVNAKRIFIDSLESLFSGFTSESILRAELRRLFRWLKEKEMTTVVTSERGVNTLTRYGLEEYLSDCVILVDNRTHQNISKRRLKIIKYRGSEHGGNEYPFYFGKNGYSILPITSSELNFTIPKTFIPTGIKPLDEMLGGKGLYKGSSVMVSGSAGTGKSTLAATIIRETCSRGERGLYISFEESPSQLKRDGESVGIDLQKWEDEGLLRFHSMRSTNFGLETHLSLLVELIEEFSPDLVVIDPVTNLRRISQDREAANTLTILIDVLKSKCITSVFTELTHANEGMEVTSTDISSMMDTWILLRDIEYYGERNKGIYILKSRGMGHSNQIREFKITNNGIDILEVYVGKQGVLTGTARIVQEQKEKNEKESLQRKIEMLRREISRQQDIFNSKLTTLKAEFESEKERILNDVSESDNNLELIQESRVKMKEIRG